VSGTRFEHLNLAGTLLSGEFLIDTKVADAVV
jgi:hypothetical protein